MIELFLNLSARSTGTLQPGQWNYIKTGLQRNVDKVRQYYQTFNPTVSSSHFLVRLLQSIPVPRTLDTDRYYANVDATALNLGMHLGMTSSISRGKVFRGVFYGGKTPEILLATDDYFDFEEVNRNWQNARPVKPLLHGKTDLSLTVPNGIAYSEEEGLTVILINIPMLAVMYRAFKASEARKANPRSINMFLASYVFPNMLPAHLELCLFNRLYQSVASAPSDASDPYRKHPFTMPKYDYYVDDAMETFLEKTSKSSLEFEQVLKNLPAVEYPSMYQSLEMPDLAPTYQVDWALTAARLKMVAFLFKVCERDLLPRNQFHINKILRAFRLNNVYQQMQQNLPIDAQREIDGYVQAILAGAQRDFF